jgi:allantoinase
LPLTVLGVAMALQRYPELTAAFGELGHEIACHGWRWIHYQDMDIATEREHMRTAVAIHRELTGQAPRGWYTGRDSPHTRQLVAEHGGFTYDSDYYGDDLPFWTEVRMRFATPQGYNSGEQFYQYLKDSFDVLYAEGDPQDANAPKMLSVGMHCRLLGRPGRFRALQRFLDHVQSHEHVWICRRIDIADHWIATHPYRKTA